MVEHERSERELRNVWWGVWHVGINAVLREKEENTRGAGAGAA